MGQMSLVGPRPCLPYEAKEYLLWHNRRFDTMPGITGLWQVSGKNRTTFRQMIRLDIYYARHLSPWLDIKILFLTLPAVLNEIMGSFQEEPGQAPSPAAPSSSPLRRISKNRAKENRNPVVEIDNA
jgi:lipopolysaccharide/colanic/teichoic acid biosynthesis glycosyltransferase